MKAPELSWHLAVDRHRAMGGVGRPRQLVQQGVVGCRDKMKAYGEAETASRDTCWARLLGGCGGGGARWTAEWIAAEWSGRGLVTCKRVPSEWVPGCTCPSQA